ncbi:uncharacterized protein LOC129960856 [Argiope bruennichi]|uniref:uncharacterized protein LOC129960856 n=1 Tax=Argiope bruennichi TaxID=94029 RepID=UPI0024941D5A|nr:uncharacterized protein LOC129960856 [Argiope bruennichi]XP_055930532.1 uncharacterized protein LOC129960856 [Argiope bruennichi]
MKTVRFQQKRFLILSSIIIFFVVMYVFWNNSQEVTDCFMSKEALKKVEHFLEMVQKPLEELRLTYFLCYNSLWGALKVKGPLPWQNSVDLCVLNKEVAAIDEGFLIRTFKRHSLNIVYNSAGGYYRISRFNELVPSATITVFEEDSITNQMRRVGFIHRMLPPNSCEELNCFPPELIASPIPTISFGDVFVPAPRDGIEIQKYLFPYSWWKEVTPLNCRKETE